MEKNFIAVYSITCPYCNFKQTGVVRVYDEKFPNIPIEEHRLEYLAGQVGYILAIKCVMDKLNGEPHCGKLITGDDLAKVTEKAVKSPSDFKSKF